ncbi:MAG: hypothetical protein IKH16_00800, partial [Selenomonadaceae bacterium]|nr:hypothetical protein [Selenomonadaceae bacterium]
MTVNYNVTGARRKEMTKVISTALGGWTVEYLGVPSCSYRVGDFEINRHGALIFDDRTDSEEVENVLEALAQAGFECETAPDAENDEEEQPVSTSQFAGPYEMPWDEDCNQKEVTEEEMAAAMAEQDRLIAEAVAQQAEREQKAEPQAEEQAEDFVDQLSVSLPNDLDEHARHNLDAVLAGKATLFKAAFQTESLAYDEDEKKLTFPWFKYSSQESMGDETNAYMLFLTKLVAYAKEAKRVTVKDKAVDNPRYAFRCFL